jgi:hypothetical protein
LPLRLVRILSDGLIFLTIGVSKFVTRLSIISESTLFGKNNVLDKTLLIYHEIKSSICCWYLITKDIVVYMFWKTIREIDVGTERLLSLHLTLSVKG